MGISVAKKIALLLLESFSVAALYLTALHYQWARVYNCITF